MSQFIVFNPTGPSGTGPILTLTGNTGGAVSPTAGGNINTVGDGSTITITGSPGTNTLTASLINQTTNTTTTNDGAYHTIITYAMNIAGEAVGVTGTIIGTRTDGANDYNAACGGPFSFVARLVGGSGTATLLTSSVTPSEDSSTGNASFQVTTSTSNVLVQVRGETGETWNWKALINYVTL